MDNFSSRCNEIINEMMLEALTSEFATLDPSIKNQLRAEITQISNSEVSSKTKVLQLREVKKRLFNALWNMNYQNIQSLFDRDTEGKLIPKDMKKYQEIMEYAIELLAGERDIFRKLSMRHIAESANKKPVAS